jgi:hypothetical protein
MPSSQRSRTPTDLAVFPPRKLARRVARLELVPPARVGQPLDAAIREALLLGARLDLGELDAILGKRTRS